MKNSIMQADPYSEMPIKGSMINDPANEDKSHMSISRYSKLKPKRISSITLKDKRGQSSIR